MSEETRKLGTEWKEWDGKTTEVPEAPISLFLTLSTFVMIIFCMILYFGLYLFYPGLANIHPFIPIVFKYIIFAITGVVGLWLITLFLAVKLNKIFFLKINDKIYSLLNVFSYAVKLGKMFGISRDKIANSFVKVNNQFVQIYNNKYKSSEIIVLLPRCLNIDTLKKIRSISDKFEIKAFVVPGGTLARQRVKENNPRAVIAVACERDLIAFVKDVSKDILTYCIPNMRPTGPCSNTKIDIPEFEKSIKILQGAVVSSN